MDRKIEKKKWTTKRIILGVGIISFVGIILYSFVLGDQSRKLNTEKDKLTISAVKRAPFQEYILITGAVQPIQTFYLDVAEGGRVVKKFVNDGAFVKSGDPIIKLDNAQMSLNIMYNEAQLFQQINNLRSTRLSMEQNKLQLQAQLLDVEYDMMDKKRTYELN
ncbi:MAG: efflux RND transporter periplasmic adaptor subunit, partial [Ignavibacteriaceae bacterium]